jgi:UDP:flavonoid glycosyltransferase YjiC (YdhE family)
MVKTMKLLFASIPADGHFNPLTALAVHLRSRGHDVRWYTGPSYAAKLAGLGVPHFPFVRATDVNGENLTERYPEYATLGVGPKAIAFALEKVFFVNLEAHLHDVLALREEFPFEAIVFDGAFYAGRLVAEKLGIPAYPVWAGPTPAPVSKTAPPPFFGLRPMRGPLGRLRDAIVMKMLASSTQGGMKIWRELRAREGLPPWNGSLFDIHNQTSRAMFMIGAPGMDFPRDDWPAAMKFVGALVPHRSAAGELPAHLAEKIAAYRGRVVVVAQGTLDNRDPEKLLVPALTALRASRYLAVATTGGRNTEELRRRFPHDNVLVEDFVDYAALMPHAALFVSNGGYGSVMQALVNGVPLLLAGKLEAKNDINARLHYRGLALDLRTERPPPRQIARGVEKVLGDAGYRERVEQLRTELASYDPLAIIERTVVGDTRAQRSSSGAQKADETARRATP